MKAQITLLLFILSGLLVAQDLDIDSLKNVIKEELKTELALENNKEKSKERLLKWSKFNLRGYGVVNYYNYGRFDTDPNIRDKMDAERLNLYLDYHFTDKLKFHSEIEFEHGGTGTTLELDVQEEFGEYEQEIEAGGEVKIEQLNIEYLFKPYLNFKMGRMKIYFNLSQRLDTPDEYFTTHRQEMEDALLPLGWYENGVLLHGRFLNDKFSYQTALVNGLESTGFSSANWIRNGYQTKFEMVNAENLAWFANLNYHFGKDKNTLAGISYYYGNTSENRPKNDLGVDAYVKIFGAHLSVFEYPFRFASQFLYGDLQNSERVSLRNRNIPATLGVKKHL